MYNIELDRYYNRFLDPNLDQENYKELLFRAGDALQSAEVNEIQTALRIDLSRLTKHFILNGEIIDGGKVNIELVDMGEVDEEGRPLRDMEITCTEGVIFANDYFINLSAALLVKNSQYVPDSDFMMGIKITKAIITQNEDEALKDPAKETMNYLQAGAGRLKLTAEWILEEDYTEDDDTEYLPLFRIKRGDIYDKNDDPAYEDQQQDTFDTFRKNVVDIVASYDRNSNGNYLIDGYEVKFMERVPHIDDDGNEQVSQLGPFKFSIADGNANVNGYNYEIDISQEIILEDLIDFELKQSEPINFTVDGWYPTRHTPIRKVFRISGQKQVTNQPITHGSFIGASDELPDETQPVISIDKVYQGSTVYVQGTDYELSGDSVKWLPGGNEPSPSTIYYVDYKYQKTETEGNFSGDNSKISDDYTSIWLEGFATNTMVNFDYDFVLQRIDAIYMDSTGKMNYTKGVPHEDDPRSPDIDTEMNLRIADVLLGGDYDPVVTPSFQRVFKMSDIQALLDNIKQNEYNITRLALQQNLQESQPGAKLMGMFVDSFEDDTKRDPGMEIDGIDGNDPDGNPIPYYKAMTIGGNLVMEIDWENFNLDLTTTIGYEQSSLEIPAIRNSNPVIYQPHWTKYRQINEYLFKSAPAATITVTPSVYRWVNKTTYRHFVVQAQASTRTISSWTRRWSWWGWRRTTVSTSTSREILGTTTSRTSSISRSRIPVNIPRIWIRIYSRDGDFNSGEPVKIYLDKKYSRTLYANSLGKIYGYFQVPSNVVSGTKEVKVVGSQSGVVGTTLFQAVPLSKTITTTTVKWWRWVVRRTFTSWWGWMDPIAQSFVLNRTISLNSIKVAFYKRPTTYVTCVVCETIGGMPNKNKALISKTYHPSEIGWDGDGLKKEFIFDNKIVLHKDKEYAFIVMCKDAVGAVQVAELGAKTKDYPYRWLTSQAYSVGVLFNSSNNSAWTALQTEDMRFWIYECSFYNSKTYDYELIDVVDATDLMVMSNAEVRKGTAVKYCVELVDRSEGDSAPRLFYENAYSQIPLEKSYTGKVKVSAILESDGTFTPVFDPHVQLSVGNSKKSSTYISVGWDFHPDGNKVVIMLDNFKPANTNIGVQIQIYDDYNNNSYTWVDATEIVSNPLGNNWVETKFEVDLQNLPAGVTIDPNQTLSRIRINLDTTNDKDRPVVGNLRLNTSDTL